MTLTDGALYDDYEQKCDECRRLRDRIKELEADIASWKEFQEAGLVEARK